jgi:alpha-beta hydrolase superfamily lysophospholipase
VWIGEELPAFGIYHAPAPANAQPTAVLFCAPFGWEDMGSYPVRRLWANGLADAGYPVLRFDLPGSGQSAGSPDDPEQLCKWLRSIAQAASWLRDAGCSSTVAAIGIGLGSLLALAAANDGAPIDDLILWGLPSSGRALTRTLRAFSQLQTAAAETDDPSLPAGWLQSGGYVLSAETLADLSALRTEAEHTGRLRRALLLDRDGSALDSALIEQLRSAGVDVHRAPGPGYAAMLDSPERSLVPDTTIATVTAWLATEHAPTQLIDEPAPPLSHELLELEIDGASVSERSFTIQHSASEAMFGVLAEPAEASRRDICLICLPAWAERCTGPSRMWVEMARRQAALGVPTLRIDLLSVGDSDGPRGAVRTTDSIWDPDRIVQVRQVMDALERAGYGSRFLLVGLCSGGYWAQQAAAVDSRVEGVLSLNPSVSPAGQALLKDDAARRTLLILKPGWWRKVARGEVSIKGVITVKRGLQHRLATLLKPPKPSSERQEVTTFAALLDRLHQRGAPITLGLAALEPAGHQLQVEGILPHSEHWPALRIHHFGSTDHNLREVRDQRTIHELLDELVQDVLRARG